MISEDRPFFPAYAGSWSSIFDRSITGPAKELLGLLIAEAPQRRPPDEIVNYQYLSDGPYLERIYPIYRFIRPPNPEHGSDRDKAIFREYCQVGRLDKYLKRSCCSTSIKGQRENKGRKERAMQ
jgi:hypothetical protein